MTLCFLGDKEERQILDWWETAARSVGFSGKGMGQGGQLARPVLGEGGLHLRVRGA